MIKADALKDLTDLEKEILSRYIKGYNYAQVTYLFEDNSLHRITFIKQMLSEHGYKINEINIFANYEHVGVILDIYW